MTRTAAEKALDVLHKAVQPLAAYRAEPPEYPGHTLVPVADLERLEAAVYSATAFEDGAVQPERESMLFRVRGSDPASPEPEKHARGTGLAINRCVVCHELWPCRSWPEASPVAATEPEGWQVLAQDLAHLDAGDYQIVAEWMIEHGWTEPLDPVATEPRSEPLDPERLARAIHNSLHSHWHPSLVTEGHVLSDQEDARVIAAAYARLDSSAIEQTGAAEAPQEERTDE